MQFLRKAPYPYIAKVNTIESSVDLSIMNDQILFKLWVLKFCLKVIYPKYNFYTFVIFLAIKYRIGRRKLLSYGAMDKFTMKTAPAHIIRQIAQEHLDDNLPVLLHKCIIISREQYIQLSAENLFYIDNGVIWLAMKLTPEIKKEYKNRKKISQENSFLKYNLGFMTSEIHKKLWNNDSSNNLDNLRIVPVIGSKLAQDSVALTNENEFYSIMSSFGLSHCEHITVSFHPVPSIEKSPKIAAIAEVSLIVNDYDLSNDFVKEVLSNYFETPKLLNVNDVFSIDLTPNVTVKYHYKYLDLVESAEKIYFKCHKVTSDIDLKDGKENSEKIIQPFFIVKGVTQLTLGENIHTLKPKDEYFKPQELDRKSMCYLQLCPTGLKEKFDQIQETITPFLTGEISMTNISILYDCFMLSMVFMSHIKIHNQGNENIHNFILKEFSEI